MGQPGRFLAGGTTLIDLMKLDVERPAHLTDITPLRENGELSQIVEDGGGVKIGALASMSQTAEHPLIAGRYPALRAALLAGASQQIRNMASMGGNVMQRTRRLYFRDLAFKECNKRDPGSGCGAREGHHRKMAILGGSERCIATHASDASVALVAYGAALTLRGPDGERTVRLEDFNLLPGDTPNIEHDLKESELIVALTLPAPIAERGVYLKVRDRESYEFALSSCAAVLDVQGGRVNAARVALGGVGTKPWRSPEAEAVLTGQPATHDPASPLYGVARQDIHPRDGGLYLGDTDQGEEYTAILRRLGKDQHEVYRETIPHEGSQKQLDQLKAGKDGSVAAVAERFARHSWGAVFVKVRVDPDFMTPRVSRVVGAFDIGQVINAKTAESQLTGGMIWGMGMALHEETHTDDRTGLIVNSDLAEYHIPVNADIGTVQAIALDHPDFHVSALGARGAGEIGIVGTAAAVANAIYHATGKRVRETPITVDKLI